MDEEKVLREGPKQRKEIYTYKISKNIQKDPFEDFKKEVQ